MLDHDFWLPSAQLAPDCFVFNLAFYARYDSQALSAAERGTEAAIDDFECRGSSLGYSPNAYFDTRYYLQMYDDVQPSIECGRFMTAFEHYCRIGHLDRSPHWLFDVTFYLRDNLDIPSGMISACGGAYGHFLAFGDREERRGHPLFDPAFYIKSNVGRKKAIDRRGPFRDYLQECDVVFPDLQCSVYFDPLWYVKRYEIANHGILTCTYRCALHHYLMCRSKAELDPIPQFSERDYRSQYADVSSEVARKSFACGYEHFLRFGVEDLRSPCLDIDLAFYSTLDIVKETLSGHGLFWHLLTFGAAHELPTARPIPRDFAISELEARRMFIVTAQRSFRRLGSRIAFDTTTSPDLDVVVTFSADLAIAAQALASIRLSFRGSIRLSGVDCRTRYKEDRLDQLFENANVVSPGDEPVKALNDLFVTTTADVVLIMDDNIIVHDHAIEFCCSYLNDQLDVGAIGGKILQPNGLILEAGGVVSRDGRTFKWLRGVDPDIAQANCVREADFCSTGFLVVRGSLLRSVGGYTPGYANEAFRAADLCLRMKEHGFRTIYEPGATITQLEHQSELDARKREIDSVDSRKALRSRFSQTLGNRPWGQISYNLANSASTGRRILFITDDFPRAPVDPEPQRACEIVNCLVNDGWHVTMLLAHRCPVHQFCSDPQISRTVEVVYAEDVGTAVEFLTSRADYYVLVWLQLTATFIGYPEVRGLFGGKVSDARLLVDIGNVQISTSVLKSNMESSLTNSWRELGGDAESLRECDHLVAVSENFAASSWAAPVQTSAGCVGFCVRSPAIIASYTERSGLLHILKGEPHTSQYFGELRLFVTEVLPLIQQGGGENCAFLTIVHDGRRALPAWLRSENQVRLVRLSENLEVPLSQHLMTVAVGSATTSDVGLVRKSAACGTPSLVSAEILECIGWSGEEFVVVPGDVSPEVVAAIILDLCKSPVSWERLRAKAFEKLGTESHADLFSKQVTAAVKAAMVE